MIWQAQRHGIFLIIFLTELLSTQGAAILPRASERRFRFDYRVVYNRGSRESIGNAA